MSQKSKKPSSERNENNQKPFWQSKRFWGLIIAVVGFIIMLLPCAKCFTVGKYIVSLGLSLGFYGSAVADKRWTVKKKKIKPTNWQKYYGCLKDSFPYHNADQVTEWAHAIIAGDIDNPIVKEFDEIYFNDRVDGKVNEKVDGRE